MLEKNNFNTIDDRIEGGGESAMDFIKGLAGSAVAEVIREETKNSTNALIEDYKTSKNIGPFQEYISSIGQIEDLKAINEYITNNSELFGEKSINSINSYKNFLKIVSEQISNIKKMDDLNLENDLRTRIDKIAS